MSRFETRAFVTSSRKASRARFPSVMSRVTLVNPRRLPALSWSAVMTTSAQKRDPSLRSRQCQLLVRLTTLQIFGGVETGKVLPDDFLGSVTLDLLRTFVPAHNLSAE